MLKTTNRGIWKEEFAERDLPTITPLTLKQFGLTMENVKPVESLEALRENPPNIIVAETKKTFKFVQNFFKEQQLKKRAKYVMGLGVFQQLQYAGNSKKKLLVPAPPQFKNVYRPYQGQPLNNGETILVFRTGGIGDLLFIQPNLLYLKEKYPTCKVKFACGPQYQPMVETWDCIDEMLDLPFALSHLINSDYHILFEGVIERCIQAHFENAYNVFSKWLGLDLPDELLVPKQDAKPELVDFCKEKLSEWGLKGNDFILMQLRASSPIRTPRHDFWLKIINELNNRGYKVVLTDNPRQGDQVDSFINMCDKKDMVFNFCKHSASIAHSIALTKLCISTFATDSAMGHIAASLDVPCFGIYGPFPGHIRLKTYKKAAWVDATRHCGPCFIHGHTPCNYNVDGYSPCYDELIETDEKLKSVIDKFEGLIKND
jgi:ADP-heptose:LPS heptosyltransferase